MQRSYQITSRKTSVFLFSLKKISVKLIEKEILNYEEVSEVFYQKSLIHLVNDNIRKISLIILAFSGLLFLIALALINNTIRLSVYSKRFLIKTMQLVGATKSF